MNLNTLQIDASTFFTDNDIDLSCRTCQGTGEVKAKPEDANIEQFAPTPEQVEEHSLEENTDYFRIVGLEGHEDEIFGLRAEAQEFLDDEDNWPDGTTESCPDCENGYLVVMWNTIWNTGFRSTHVELPASIGNVTVFEHEEEIWFSLSGCGMDLTPSLCQAWFECFPNATWVPDEWINHTNLFGGYYASVAGKATEDRLLEVLEGQYKAEIDAAKYNQKRLAEFLKARKAKA